MNPKKPLKEIFQTYKIILKNNTETYRVLGEKLGVTRQRAEQITKKFRKEYYSIEAVWKEFKVFKDIDARQIFKLKRNKITLEDLKEMSKEEIQKIKGIGPKTSKRIKEALGE